MPVSKKDIKNDGIIDVSKLPKINFNFNFEQLGNLSETLKKYTEISHNIHFPTLIKSLPPTRKSTPETAIKNLKEAFKNEKLCFVLRKLWHN